ncbi:AhpC/TSA family protein [Halosquirtibacter laminarini]|uniref:AhpC/TSA family protein n=1 Tax=Halosquirtibacter laminarini TaxID=3374600 RepID=A0AC61NC36_9BACT|nr:AhpC/TSA family protein [Prolixibacteraceae bacterium]
MRKENTKFAYLLIALFCLLFSSCNKEKRYVIKGDVEGLKDGYIYLQVMGVDGPIKVDSTEVYDNEFTFDGVVKKPTLCYLGQGDNLRGAFIVFVENSKIKIYGDINDIKHVEIKGSKTQESYRAFYLKNDSLESEVKKLRSKYNELLIDPINNEKFITKLSKNVENKENELKNYQVSYITDNASSYVSPYVLSVLSYYLDLTKLENLYYILSPEVRQTYEGYWVENRLKVLKRTQIGAIAPDFSMKSLTGEMVRLSDEYKKNKYTLIDFWASWCSPCRVENPNIVKAYNKYHEAGFGVLGVSLDMNRSSLERVIKQDKIVWMNVTDLNGWKNSVADLYGIKFIPANLLVDRDGRIIARNLRGDALFKKLDELL